jgi:glycosyltransferase involved in cell wall biosynthesis
MLTDVLGELGRRVDLHVFALRYPYCRGVYRLDDVEVHALGGGHIQGRRKLGLVTRAVTAIVVEHRKARFDVLHGVWIDEPGFVAAACGKLLGVPTVVSVMGGELVALPEIGYGGRLSAVNRLLAALALRGASRVTAGCSDGVERARRFLSAGEAGKVQRLVWGVNSSVFASPAQPVELEGNIRVLHVGSLAPIKDQVTLLRAFAQFKGQEPGAHLHLAGDGPLQATLASDAQTLGVADAVTFHGYVPRDRLAAYFQAAHVLAISSRHEGQLVAAVEAAFCGLPIAGTAVGLIADLAPGAAIAVPVGDVAALGDALATLCDPEVARAHGTALQAIARSEYGAGQTAERLATLYDEIVGVRSNSLRT